MGKLEDTKDLIRELADMLEQSGLTEIEIEDEEVRIRVVREGGGTIVQAPPATSTVQPASAPAGETVTHDNAQTEQPGQAPAEDAASSTEEDIDYESHPGAVTSPMVGTAYMAPEPGAEPFVSEGEQVEEGQTLMIVEAMKVMNHIPAPHAGTVKKVLVDDAVPVEFGQPLMIIE